MNKIGGIGAQETKWGSAGDETNERAGGGKRQGRESEMGRRLERCQRSRGQWPMPDGERVVGMPV